MTVKETPWKYRKERIDFESKLHYSNDSQFFLFVYMYIYFDFHSSNKISQITLSIPRSNHSKHLKLVFLWYANIIMNFLVLILLLKL